MPPSSGSSLPTGTARILRFPLLASLLLAGEVFGLYAQLNRNLNGFIIAALLQGAVWAVAAVLVTRGAGRPSLRLILVTAILLRLGALAAPVYLSDDVYRYIWDGRVQAAGINPYHYIPTDTALAALRDEAIFPNINRNNYAPTIYPPVAQMLFLGATRFGETVPGVKLVLIAIEAIGISALLMVLRTVEAPTQNILFYVWHPLPVWEIAGSGHIDAAVVAFVALALAAAVSGRRACSGAALAAATLVKFFPLVLVPALWRPTRSNGGDWRWLSTFAAVVIAAYLPYLGAGSRVLGFLPAYITEENLSSGSGFWLLDAIGRTGALPVTAYLAVAATVMAGLAVGALRRPAGPRASLAWATTLGTATMLFASPHYAWYFVWLVALLCVAPWWPAFWPTLTAVLLYWEPETGRTPLWVGFTIYGGFAILGCVDIAWRFAVAARFGEHHGRRRAS
jgi:alpha-1,6-mannosyltransferase